MAQLLPSIKSRAARVRRGLLGEPQVEPASYRLEHAFPGGAKVRVESESDWWIYNEVFVDHEYDGAIDLALERARDKGSAFILDIGANVGYFGARIVERATESSFATDQIDVLMVEGSPTVYSDLTSRYRDNPLPGARTAIVHGLVGQRSGEGEMLEIPFGARNTLRPEHNAALSEMYETQRVKVPYLDLMQHVGAHPRIDLLKCDVEGSEQAVLETYHDDLFPLVEVAVLEFHHQLCDIALCRSLLNGAGLEQAAISAETDTTTLEVFVRP